jgi:hypothetical protein
LPLVWRRRHQHKVTSGHDSQPKTLGDEVPAIALQSRKPGRAPSDEQGAADVAFE